MKKIFPIPTIRGDDNWIDDINSSMNYIVEEFIDSNLKIKEGPTCSLVWKNNKSDGDYFIGKIITEGDETLYSLKLVFNRKGLSSLGLFSLYQSELEKTNKKEVYSQHPILLMGETTLKKFFETFLEQITTKLKKLKNMETDTFTLIKFPPINPGYDLFDKVFTFFEILKKNIEIAGFQIIGYSGINNKMIDIYRLSVTVGGEKPKKLTLAISPTGKIVCYAVLPINQHGHSVPPASIIHDGPITTEEFNDIFPIILEHLKK